jgi:hypothetical protein
VIRRVAKAIIVAVVIVEVAFVVFVVVEVAQGIAAGA